MTWTGGREGARWFGIENEQRISLESVEMGNLMGKLMDPTPAPNQALEG